MYDKILAARPDDVALLERQSEVWHRLGDLDYRTDPPTANAAYRKAIAIRERLAAAHPAEPRFRMALSRSLNGLAISTDAAAEVRDAYRRSLELRLKLADEIPEDPDLLHGLSESFLNLGVVLWNDGHREEAVELTTHAIDYGRAGVARRPHDLEFASDLAAAYSNGAAYFWQLGRRDEALALSAEGIAFVRKLSAENPDVRAYRDALANALGARSRYLAELGRADEAVSSARAGGRDPGDEAGPGRRRPGDRRVLSGSPRRGAGGRRRGARVPVLAGGGPPRGGPGGRGPEGGRRPGLPPGRHRPRGRAFKSLLTRDDVKSLLAEMERPPAEPAPRRRRHRRPPRVRPRRWTGRAGSRRIASWAS